PYNPWEDTGGGSSDTGDTRNAETEPAETEPEIDRIWLPDLFEPEGPILETDYTMNDFDGIREILGAVTYFEGVTVSYPGTFVEATEEKEAYFDPDLEAGLRKFQQYRK
ncbi:MAG: hypothetical protein IJ037_01155, partial [Clostridia bacterium]|nr:hypothetical protein [Clostridia bacterium]